MSKPRAASKAFLKALAKMREEDSRKSPEEKYLDGRGHPQTVRAFGVELTRSMITTQAGGRPIYRGGEPGYQIAHPQPAWSSAEPRDLHREVPQEKDQAMSGFVDVLVSRTVCHDEGFCNKNCTHLQAQHPVRGGGYECGLFDVRVDVRVDGRKRLPQCVAAEQLAKEVL